MSSFGNGLLSFKNFKCVNNRENCVLNFLNLFYIILIYYLILVKVFIRKNISGFYRNEYMY